MLHEVRVSPVIDDPDGEEVVAEARRSLGIVSIDSVTTTKVYRLEGVSDEDAAMLARKLLTDPVSESATIDKLPAARKVVQKAYRPGVTNPASEKITKAAADLGVHPVAADVATEYTFTGRVTRQELEAITSRLLVNKQVEEVVTSKPKTLVFEDTPDEVRRVPIRDATPEELEQISKDKLFLNGEEMKVVQAHFQNLGREPTDCELEVIAARWSEHCVHKTFGAKVIVNGEEKKPFFTRIKEKAREHFKGLVISAFEDNSGVMEFYEGQAICGKVETHNSPSAIEPYGGAMTGSGGVFRDIMGTGQGAKVILSTDMFCFAPKDLKRSQLPPGTLSPDYLQRRVVAGVRDYGNRFGVPTANGSVHFHEDFVAKPTVMVGSYGILPREMAEKGTPQLGDLVVIIGGRTGRDGIHGATFSSGEMTDRTASVNSSAVQIGNAIEEKRMADALIEARDAGLIRALTDAGAAGFSSAIGEMGENIGVEVDISLVPLKYSGLAPWEIWLSESQERMVAAISPEDINDFLAICEKHNVESTVIGSFNGKQTLTVNYADQNVVQLDYDFLKNGLPQRTMIAEWKPEKIPDVYPESPTTSEIWIDRLKAVLSHGNVCSKEPIVRQYDHGVQGTNIVPPFGGPNRSGPNDAVVLRPMLGKPYGVVQAHGMNPILNRYDPYQGTIWATVEAAANFVAAGGNIDEAVVVGNYVSPFPDEETLGALNLSVDAAYHMMDVLGMPVISGKDSLSSTYRGNNRVIKIPPVYTASIFGRIPDVEQTMTSYIKKPGESVLMLIGNLDDKLGGSTYLDVTGGQSSEIPVVDLKTTPDILREMHRAIKNGRILAAHDISEGGLITTVSEMCFGSDCGADIEIPKEQDPEFFLFSETAGCFVVEVDEEEAQTGGLFAGLPHRIIGRTQTQPEVSVNKQDYLFNVLLAELREAWQNPLKELFHVES